MKKLTVILLLFVSVISYSQGDCRDSSFLIRYRFEGKGHLRIEATASLKDSGKVFNCSFFSLTLTGYVENFIVKINKAGDIVWVKRINDTQFPLLPFSVETIVEGSNGNLFVTLVSANLNTKPNGYIVLSGEGDIINQKRIDILNIPGINSYGQGKSLVLSYGNDSMLLVFTYIISGIYGDKYFIVPTDLNGTMGNGYFFSGPDISRSGTLFYLGAVESNNINLWATTRNYNSVPCQPGYIITDEFTYLSIDWRTKELVRRKVYCSPFEASWYGYMSGNYEVTGTTNGYVSRSFFYRTDDNRMIIARRYLGLDINGNDTTNRLFSVSEYDEGFNHLKSYYITAKNRFKNKAVYELDFNRKGTGRIKVFDYEEKALFYSFSNQQNEFLSTKKKQLPGVNYTYPLLGNDMNNGTGGRNLEMIVGDVDGNNFLDLYSLRKEGEVVCFGEEEGQLFFNQPASVTELDWKGDFTVEKANIYASPMHFEMVDKEYEQQVLCKTVNICNSISVSAVSKNCNINEPVVVTVNKNRQCTERIAFAFDTTATQKWEQINDTTLVLLFAKSYRGKVFARLGSCKEIADSVSIVVQDSITQLNIGDDFTYCPGASYTLHVDNELLFDFKWQDNSTGNSFTVKGPGKYFVSALDYCENIYTDTVVVYKREFELIDEKVLSLCNGETYSVKVPDGYVNYNWTSPFQYSYIERNWINISPNKNADYFLSAEVFNGCIINDTLHVAVKDCPQYLYFPNSFTPDGDGINDIFKPYSGGVFKSYRLEIFNRWGQLVFKTDRPDIGWDGRIKGVMQNSGIFVWNCNYQFYNQQAQFKKGVLSLLY